MAEALNLPEPTLVAPEAPPRLFGKNARLPIAPAKQKLVVRGLRNGVFRVGPGFVRVNRGQEVEIPAHALEFLRERGIVA